MLDTLDKPVLSFVNPKLIVVNSELTVKDAASVMVDSGVDSVLVFENSKVVGILTNKDIISDVVAKGQDPSKIQIRKIMRHPIIEIHKNASVRTAIELMKKHNIRRLVVKDDLRTIGTISQKKIVGDLEKFSIAIPELESPTSISCPYCKTSFDNQQKLLWHIEKNHI